jgi:ATP-dependent DNA helicase RecG
MVGMQVTDSVEVLKGVGEAMAKHFAELKVHTVEDLLCYTPFRYEDFSQLTPVAKLHPGPVTVQATLKTISGRYVRRGMHITEALFSDHTGSIRAIWFNQPYRENGMKKGEEYFVSGHYELAGQRFQLTSPSAELVKDFPVNTARIIPIYRQTKSLKSTQIRKVIASNMSLLRLLPESLPSWVIEEYGLIPRAEAIETMHFPETLEALNMAKHRLGFEEVFELSLASLLNKQQNTEQAGTKVAFDETAAKLFVEVLPFQLTDDQRKVCWRIYKDLEAPHPMNRIVEGDVGSGKTVVAAMAAVMAMHHGYQVALMAPTELLARQHAETLTKLFAKTPFAGCVQLLVGSLSPKDKQQAHEAIARGKALFMIGTSALIQDAVDMHNLALVIIDEQHRFGVEQRKALMKKAGKMPHVLSLTATPIPRSLALTLYGELDVSVITQKPAGRLPIHTELISEVQRKALYERIDVLVGKGQQVYVVCPLIDKSETMETKSSALHVHAELNKKLLPHRKVGLLHGKMKADEKQAVMQQFMAGDIAVLVSTTVIEVGVDVPNATVMVVESAETFGLAQLHQLRGRVGRGASQSYCFLMTEGSKAPSKRLRAIASSNDGFRLAELDLELRGPGAIYGAMQHGALDLKIAKLTDAKLIASARQAAHEFIERGEDLVNYTEVQSHVQILRKVTHLN